MNAAARESVVLPTSTGSLYCSTCSQSSATRLSVRPVVRSNDSEMFSPDESKSPQ
jgi:hypothetical protein